MSTITTADQVLLDAKRKLKQVSTELSKILIEDCWGSEEYSDSFKKYLWEVMKFCKEAEEKI